MLFFPPSLLLPTTAFGSGLRPIALEFLQRRRPESPAPAEIRQRKRCPCGKAKTYAWQAMLISRCEVRADQHLQLRPADWDGFGWPCRLGPANFHFPLHLPCSSQHPALDCNRSAFLSRRRTPQIRQASWIGLPLLLRFMAFSFQHVSLNSNSRSDWPPSQTRRGLLLVGGNLPSENRAEHVPPLRRPANSRRNGDGTE